MTKQRKIALLRFADALELFMQENSISSSINKIKKIASLVQNKKSSQNAIAQKIVAAENSLQSSYVVAKKVCALIYENVVI